jgi:serine/threonine-protein phosphatase 2A regulatory subunit B'
MCFFENDYFLNILKTYKDKTFPMLVPIIVDLAENHWHKILQESLIALKTILKEIDPLAFDEALKMNPIEKKKYTVKQDPEDRKALDNKWDNLN